MSVGAFACELARLRTGSNMKAATGNRIIAQNAERKCVLSIIPNFKFIMATVENASRYEYILYVRSKISGYTSVIVFNVYQECFFSFIIIQLPLLLSFIIIHLPLLL